MMNPLGMKMLISAMEKGPLETFMVLFWWYIIMPMTIYSLFADSFNKISDRAILQVNDPIPQLAGHWKNPFYHFCILVCALSKIVGSPLAIILNLMDRK